MSPARLRLVPLVLLTLVTSVAPVKIVSAQPGTMIVTSYNNGLILRYDVSGPTPVFLGSTSLPGFNVDGMAFDDLDRLLVNNSSGSVGRIGRYSTDFSTYTTLNTASGVSFLDLDRNATHLFYGVFSGPGSGSVWRSNLDGTGLASFITTTYSTDGVRIGPGGFLYVVNSEDGSVRRYDPSTGAFLGNFITSGFSGIGSQLEFGPGNRVYVSRTIGGVATILRYDYDPLNLAAGASGEAVLGTLGSGTATGLRFGPDGRLYANNFGDDSVWRTTDPVTGLTMTATFTEYVLSGSNSLWGPGSIQFVPIPEPTTITLLAAGTLAAWSYRRRKKRQSELAPRSPSEGTQCLEPTAPRAG